jgi:hypothetical protein
MGPRNSQAIRAKLEEIATLLKLGLRLCSGSGRRLERPLLFAAERDCRVNLSGAEGRRSGRECGSHCEHNYPRIRTSADREARRRTGTAEIERLRTAAAIRP